MGIFDIFKNKKIKGSSNETKISSNKPVLPDLAKDVDDGIEAMMKELVVKHHEDNK